MTPVTMFREVRIFDGARMLAADSVLVRDGSIAAVGSGLATPAAATVVEGAGQTVLPGLIDAHTHLMHPSQLRQALIFGVTTELDMFTDWRLARSIKAHQAPGEDDDMADLRSAGTAVTAPGGRGTQFAPGMPTIAGPGEAQEFVDARLAEGSDYIKIMYEDGRSTGQSLSAISKATLAAVVAAAHRRIPEIWASPGRGLGWRRHRLAAHHEVANGEQCAHWRGRDDRGPADRNTTRCLGRHGRQGGENENNI